MSYQRTSQHANHIHRQHDDWDEVHNQLLAIQKKSLEVSDPNDADEKEADTIARKVMSGESVQIHGAGSTINRKGKGSAETTPEFQSQLESSKGGGQSLDDSTRSEMESKMGADFSGVKIHTGSNAHVMNEGVNAKAFAHGNDIYFRQGEYNPKSNGGKELLAHELAHTKQQAGNVIQRVEWTEPAPVEDNPFKRMMSKQTPGLTVPKINDKSSTTVSINEKIFPALTDLEVVNPSPDTYTVKVKPTYTIKSGVDMIIAGAPDSEEGWTMTFNPAKYKELAADSRLAGVTSIKGIMQDPVDNNLFIDRVKNGEMQHAAEIKRHSDTYFTAIEKRMREMSADGKDMNEALNNLKAKIIWDDTMLQLMDVYVMDQNASNEKYDNAAYGLHHSGVTLSSVSADKKKAYFKLDHRYSDKVMSDPKGEKTTDENFKPYFQTIAPTKTTFDPNNLSVSGTKIIYTDSKTTFKSFSTTEQATAAKDTITAYGFTAMDKIGPFELFLVNESVPSGNKSTMSTIKVDPQFLTVAFDGKWHIGEALKRIEGKPQTRQILTFSNTQEGMNQAYSAFDLITKNKAYNFYYTGTLLSPKMSFFAND
jgi:hypothetical protein